MFLFCVHHLLCFSKNCSFPCKSPLPLWEQQLLHFLCSDSLKRAFWKISGCLLSWKELLFAIHSYQPINTFKEHRWQMLSSLNHGRLLPINMLSFLPNFDPKEGISSFAYFKASYEGTWWIVLSESTSSLAPPKYSNNFSWFPPMKTVPTLFNTVLPQRHS